MTRLKTSSRIGAALAAVAILFCMAPRATAQLQFIGQWQVDSGPDWPTNPPVYSGQEAAALLFGGPASKYSISTLGTNPNLVDHQAWYSIWGVDGGTKAAESLHLDLGAPGYDDPGGTNSAWSAYVKDHAIGPNYINYAFVRVPEPSAITLCGLGAIGLFSSARRRRA